MHKYIVKLREYYAGEYLEETVFECMANSEEHAETQARDSYRDGCIDIEICWTYKVLVDNPLSLYLP